MFAFGNYNLIGLLPARDIFGASATAAES